MDSVNQVITSQPTGHVETDKPTDEPSIITKPQTAIGRASNMCSAAVPALYYVVPPIVLFCALPTACFACVAGAAAGAVTAAQCSYVSGVINGCCRNVRGAAFKIATKLD